MSQRGNELTRREFLTRSVSGAAAAGFIGIPAAAGETRRQDVNKTPIHRTLGKTGIRIPIVNMGIMNTMDAALVKKSYEIGVRLFDTAMHYRRGLNEEMLGKAIEDLGVRQDVVIATKVFAPAYRQDMSRNGVKEKVISQTEASLRRLKIEYADILSIHVVDSVELMNHEGILEGLRHVKDQGMARFVGISTHSNMTDCLKDAVDRKFYDVVLTAVNYSMSGDTAYLNAVENAAASGIGLLAMKTQCKQPWYQRLEPGKSHKFYEGEIMHTALLKWVLRNEAFAAAVPGYTNYQQMEEDFSVAYSLDYTEKEKNFLEDRGVKLAMASVCRFCARCVPSCPKNADIPNLMRTHMYAACYNNFHQAKETLAGISKNRGIDACRTCESCRALCANRVAIGERIDELKAIYA